MTKREIKASIVRIIDSKDNFEDSDELLLKELLYNVSLLAKAKTDISKNGILFNNKENPSLAIYRKSLDTIKNLYIALGITPKERIKFKVDENTLISSKVASEIEQFEKSFDFHG